MTTNSVSKEHLSDERLASWADQAEKASIRGPGMMGALSNHLCMPPNELYSILTELLSLRTSSDGVTSGEVVTDEMVERAARAICLAQGYDEKELDDIGSLSRLPLWMDKKGAAVAALTAALSSLHAQPGWSDPEELERVEVEVKALLSQPQGTGSRESVAWLNFDAECEVNATFNEAAIEMLDPVPGHVEPLVPLSQLQAVERERDDLREQNERMEATIIRHNLRAETAEASLAAAREEGAAARANFLTMQGTAATLVKRLDTAREALTEIAEATDPDNPESYRADDREGCLDTVQATARTALAGSNG